MESVPWLAEPLRDLAAGKVCMTRTEYEQIIRTGTRMNEIPSGYGELPDNKEDKPAISAGFVLLLLAVAFALMGTYSGLAFYLRSV